MRKCERCGKTEGRDAQGQMVFFDYCAECSKNLCPACMAKGCCGSVPAKSGDADDSGDDSE